jgi:erythromycin esterase
VAALDGETGDVVDYPVPDPPSGSIPDVFRRVDEPLFCVPVDDLYEVSSTREWLRTRPRRHDIWGGHPDGDTPVHYRPSDLGEFDWVVFVRETSPLAHPG